MASCVDSERPLLNTGVWPGGEEKCGGSLGLGVTASEPQAVDRGGGEWKLSNLNILEEDDQKGPLHGQRICLHPRFDPQDEEEAMKADIGMVLLSKPIYGDDVPLSHVPNVSLKSCSKCHYRSCQVYQHHSDPEFGVAGVKKILVQLLELSVCHPQYSHHEKNTFLCILSQPDQDCWVQQASPVLCLLNNHWELVGLVDKTSRICRHPAIIIKTAPYLSWIKQLIKASKKLLNPTSYLHCKAFFERVQVSQISQGYNYAPTLASYNPSVQSFEENIGISPDTKHLKISPAIYNFNGADSFTTSHKFSPEKSHIPQDGNFLVEQLSSSSEVRLPENPRNNSAQNHQDNPLLDTGDSWDPLLASTAKPFLPQLISDTTMSYNSPKSWDFPLADTDESWNQVVADIVKQWSPSVDGAVEPWNSHDTRSWVQSTDGSWAKATVNTDRHLESFRPYTDELWDQPTTTTMSSTSRTFHSYDKEGPWSSINSGENSKAKVESQESVIINKGEPIDRYLIESTWIPPSTGTIDPWSSPSEYHTAKAQDLSVVDSVNSQNHPVVDMNRLQLLSIADMAGSSTHSKMGADATLAAAFEAKIIPHQVKSSTTSFQGQTSFRDRIQHAADIESLQEPEIETAELQAQSYPAAPLM
ncbi:hypothetical protein SUZIE_212925 [Sciurus carolinensis]|uniref:Peptidase S1 domain-containing protein n=1 Tax=Sciurus carolinensis TaxID=30640 RepID=A0AA41NKF0_SCICA|nr:hypothetical protein [Sciurus carolinensis]